MNNHIRSFCSFLALVVLTLQTSNATQPASAKPVIELKACSVPGLAGEAKCGTLEVFENRATGKGRKISLKVLVLPATGANRQPDPFVYFAGGPGSAATEDANGLARAFAKLREQRDLLFVDQRGTGSSNPLNCAFYNPADLQSYLGYFFPLAEVKKCREKLETTADLKLYTTSIAMDDLDDVRAALGYERLNLFGASYGTRAALVYLRRHPDHVRTVMLQGVAPTNQFMPRNFAQQTERALQGVISECVADEACNGAFPNLRTEAKSLLEQLLKGPVEVEVRKPDAPRDSTERVKVRLSRDLAAEAIRYMLYNPVAASRVPLIIHLAAQGNFTPLAQTALNYRLNLVATGSNGMYLSVTCAEDLPWIKPGEGEKLSANTFLGDYRLVQQRQACELWPRATIQANYAAPVRSDLPVLIMTGEWDPVTAPANGDGVSRTLPNSLHVVVPHGAHGFGGLEGIECIERLSQDFVERGTTTGLDTSCVKKIKRRGFVLKNT
jgi:pimeloyl-ACP methyl ester carboxylesterase